MKTAWNWISSRGNRILALGWTLYMLVGLVGETDFTTGEKGKAALFLVMFAAISFFAGSEHGGERVMRMVREKIAK